MKTTKVEKILLIIRNYVIPVVAVLFGLGVIWTDLKYDIVTSVDAIRIVKIENKELEVKIEDNKDSIGLILQELRGMNVKLDYIIKELDNR